ncbi:T9SS type A sorting domain-containing protein, partial [Hydrotalea sp.]|uniref:T9SS type A sorting domain-containing protein n=1 Tax=Hydrotalea sp. TaxID=2881279 RepID=UPI00261E6441
RWSDNRGDTWSAATTVSIPTARQSWMPWVSVDDTNGNVFVTYFCMENPNNFNTNTFVAASVNGFTTFQNRVVSDVAHVTAQIPQFFGGYAGDYIGIAAHGGRGFAAWMDNRNGVWQNYVSEVRAADIELTGNSSLCGASNTYTLIGVPAGSAINWTSPTPSGIVNISTNGNTATLTQNGGASGVVTLSAEVIDGGCSYGLFSIQITVGTPKPGPVSWTWNVPPNRVMLDVDDVPGATSYQWYLDGVLKGTTAASYYHLPMKGNVSCGNFYYFGVRAINICGVSEESYVGANMPPCSFAYTIYPNPGSGNINIESINESDAIISEKKSAEIREIEIIDKMGVLRQKQKFSIRMIKVYISVSNLPTDIYLLRIFDGKNWQATKIVVQH